MSMRAFWMGKVPRDSFWMRERDHAEPYRAIVHDTHWREIMKTRRTRVYVAGPFSSDPGRNTDRAIDAADALLNRGYAPFVPHLNMYWDARWRHPYDAWLSLDLEYVTVCDVLLRVEGDSPGADIEVTAAKAAGLDVYYSLDTLFACVGATVDVTA